MRLKPSRLWKQLEDERVHEKTFDKKSQTLFLLPVLINNVWLCAAVVSHSQPQSKWLQRVAKKQKFFLKKLHVLGHYGNF